MSLRLNRTAHQWPIQGREVRIMVSVLVGSPAELISLFFMASLGDRGGARSISESVASATVYPRETQSSWSLDRRLLLLRRETCEQD